MRVFCTSRGTPHSQLSVVCLSVCVQGTPFDYQSPEATDNQPYSTFSTLEHRRAQHVEPRYVTPPPPVLAEQNEMHVVSLGMPPPLYGKEDMV